MALLFDLPSDVANYIQCFWLDGFKDLVPLDMACCNHHWRQDFLALLSSQPLIHKIPVYPKKRSFYLGLIAWIASRRIRVDNLVVYPEYASDVAALLQVSRQQPLLSVQELSFISLSRSITPSKASIKGKAMKHIMSSCPQSVRLDASGWPCIGSKELEVLAAARRPLQAIALRTLRSSCSMRAIPNLLTASSCSLLSLSLAGHSVSDAVLTCLLSCTAVRVLSLALSASVSQSLLLQVASRLPLQELTVKDRPGMVVDDPTAFGLLDRLLSTLTSLDVSGCAAVTLQASCQLMCKTSITFSRLRTSYFAYHLPAGRLDMIELYQAAEVMQIIEACPRAVQSLHIARECRLVLSAEVLKVISLVWGTHLRELCMPLEDSTADAMEKFFSHCANLQVVELAAHRSTHQRCLDALAAHCPGVLQLSIAGALSLTHCRLVPVLRKYPALTKLSLKWCMCISDELLAVLPHYCPLLEVLVLDGTAVSKQGISCVISSDLPLRMVVVDTVQMIYLYKHIQQELGKREQLKWRRLLQMQPEEDAREVSPGPVLLPSIFHQDA